MSNRLCTCSGLDDGCTGVYCTSVQVCTGMYVPAVRLDDGCTGVYKCVQVCTGVYVPAVVLMMGVQVCTGVYRCVQVCTYLQWS